ncbi:hypothetical protein CLAFUW4_12356 [Fulvia fulva]|uniref:Proteasome inhibitor PI31 subunit n=1 Tax=Passalora fulva TaxID=5499 RepID=A0A9Q8USN0_PASFU|nr:uncharacterized protein CLAFUR5_11385 [Fulvia fulva]KAK4618131.1 hypothetical protein CLAFUR4_12361 [Fulvia fulva]KAK4618806.1 hypothetical protein CLAFUR0_12372 [Fulvia fulva]UJO20952.1 hypothetical protein CLAFUR5_11385 [Fulvia fulva]WPV17865.1 hypothetical protein CLAFUW4_12356 [Fulvia fulva]WPV33210.1 hypothetical protein CLAFUW7_12363 [Fulvia fulva]
MAATAPPNALSGKNLSQIMVASLPTDAQKVTQGYEAIALAAHASMLAVGFRLVGLNEDNKIEAHSDADQTQPLPSEWNAHSGSYAFRYKHDQSSMEYLVKANRMGNKVIVMGMGMGDDRTAQFEVKITDFISEGNLPFTMDGATKEQAAERLNDTFITVGRLSDFGSQMRVQLMQKLIPGLHKEGYEESDTQSNSRQPIPGREDDRPRHDPLRDERDPPARPHHFHDPLAQPLRPRGPMPEPMPGFEDPYDLQRPMRGQGQGGFGNIGERDLHPQGLGPNDPMRGGIGPGFGGPMGGGGMHPTFDDPLFAGQGRRGGGYNPQAPPGARYEDPFGQGGPQGGHPRGAGMGGRPPNPFGGFGDGDFI